MGSHSKGRKLVKGAVEAFCEEHGYSLVEFNTKCGRKSHGKITVDAKGHRVTVGMSSSPKGGWQSTALMVVDHLKRKIRDRQLMDERRSSEP